MKLFGKSATEDIVASPNNLEDEQFDAVVGEMENILMDDHFVSLQSSFFKKHYDTFTDDEENKLEYTTLFNEYNRVIEEYLTSKLSAALPWFSMSKFMSLLKARPDQAEGDVFEMLQTLGDFAEFKDLMVNYQRAQQGKNVDLSGLLSVTSHQ